MPITQGLRIGALLYHDTYRIEKVLGQGGFGITYMATDLNLERKVAIKEFFPKDYCNRDGATSQMSVGTTSSVDFVARLKEKFLKEARNIAKFNNAGIIKIHTAFEENNTAYYVMDYINGSSLSEMVKASGPIPVAKALKYIEQVADALEFVHQRRMNHLDVKPANVMVRPAADSPTHEDAAVLIDFGLSKQYDSKGQQTSTTPVGLSHGFAPMEQYNEGGVKEFSPQTDIYSLGATLYYILSGVVPPQAPKLFEEELTFPSSIPQNLVPVISKAMATSRKNRYATVGDFIADLKAARSGHAQPRKQVNVPDPETVIEPADVKYAPVGTKNKNGGGSGKMRTILIVAATAIVVFLGLAYCGNHSDGEITDNDTTAVETDSAAIATTAADMKWESPLGPATYSGAIDPDGKPHGLGMATITGGELKGNVYKGEFVHGQMEGNTTYTLANGDRFVGTFKDNKYASGRYYNKQYSQYFEGTFDKDGNPAEGEWKPYDNK